MSEKRGSLNRGLTAVFVIVGVLLALSSPSQSQNSQYQGDSAAWGPASSTTPTNAHDYVDASAFSGSDFCDQIHTALGKVADKTSQYHGIAVIDARGIYPPAGVGYLSCSASPWSNLSSPPFATILLPAAVIKISSGWSLPDTTKIVGQGPDLTTIQAASSLAPMIDMGSLGSNSICQHVNDCNSVGVEHLHLDGGNSAQIGIRNSSSQELSYVNDVWLTGMASGGTGLQIIGHYDTVGGSSLGEAANSGPYSNIYFSGSGPCVNIAGTYGTRGIHGLTCIGNNTGSTAVLVDGNNNSIEDVYISGYANAITLGSQPLYAQSSPQTLSTFAQGNVLLNITGGAGVTNVVHICGPGGNTTAPCSSTLPTTASLPSDITIMGVSSAGSGNTVLDEITSSALTDSSVGLYILGEAVGGSSTYPVPTSRFTTSPNRPTWLVGGTAPAIGATCTAKTGTLFSATTSAPTLSLCAGGKWATLQQ